jgi:hypothetical protein
VVQWFSGSVVQWFSGSEFWVQRFRTQGSSSKIQGSQVQWFKILGSKVQRLLKRYPPNSPELIVKEASALKG